MVSRYPPVHRLEKQGVGYAYIVWTLKHHASQILYGNLFSTLIGGIFTKDMQADTP
jgi:hypothetical protein